MFDVVIKLLVLKFYTHIAHNLYKGADFISVHKFLGECYEQHESDYDDLVERLIGTNNLGIGEVTKVQLAQFLTLACAEVIKLDCNYLINIQNLEKELVTLIENISCNNDTCNFILTEGTIQLIGEISNKSEIRQYKLRGLL